MRYIASCSITNALLLKLAYSSCIQWTNVKDYNDCLTKVIANLGPELAEGISDFNLPPLDPYYNPNIYLKYDLPLFDLRLNLSNYQIFNATKYTVHSVKADPYNLLFSAKLKLPYVISHTDYDVQGNLLFVDITGVGKFVGNFSELSNFKEINLQSQKNKLFAYS